MPDATRVQATAVGLAPQCCSMPRLQSRRRPPGTFQWGGALGSHWFVDPAVGQSVVVLTNTSVVGVIDDFFGRDARRDLRGVRGLTFRCSAAGDGWMRLP